MTILETEHLILRPFTADDAQALHTAVYGDDEVMTYLPGGRARSLSQAQTVIDYFIDHEQQRGYSAWAVILKETGELIGQCGLRFIDEIQQVEVFYALARSAWGKGYASEAAHTSLRYGFSTLKLGKIVALIARDNLASQRVAAKLEMHFRREIKLFKMTLKMYSISRDEFYVGTGLYKVR